MLIRGENPLKPKLPFLSNADVVIKPTSSLPEIIFDITTENNEIVNKGNIPVRIFDLDESNQILLPNDYYKPKGNSVRIESFSGDVKTIEIDIQTTNVEISSKLFNESLLFFIFVLSFLMLNNTYNNLKKIWK